MKSPIGGILDAAIAPGFSRIGYAVRSRLNNWQSIQSYECTGKVFVITGPTAGLGRALTFQLAATGAELVLVARNPEKLAELVAELKVQFPASTFHSVIADVSDLSAVASASQQIVSLVPRIDALIHNAGALLPHRELTSDGREVTVTAHVLGPHLMTTMLLEVLRTCHGRVITVSSGGMYAAALPTADSQFTLEMQPEKYDGTRQYAIAKRAQVTLNEMWATREPEIFFAAMHPGWADTPGVQSSLPQFRRFTQPILRTSDQGADTTAWLAAVPECPGESGKFWSDREVRSIHKTLMSRRADTPAARAMLWAWCEKAITPFL